jgi:hypothetical protein
MEWAVVLCVSNCRRVSVLTKSIDRLIADRHSLEDLFVLEWLVLIGVWIAPQPDLMSGFGSATALIAWYKYADRSYCDSGCVWSGREGMLVVVVVVMSARVAMAGV